MNGCSTFLSRQLRYIHSEDPDTFLSYMKLAQDFFLARQDFACYHLIGAKIYLYNFMHEKTHKLLYWRGYLYHKSKFFELLKH